MEFLEKFYSISQPISILETELTDTLANDHFDDLYGAALNLPT